MERLERLINSKKSNYSFLNFLIDMYYQVKIEYMIRDNFSDSNIRKIIVDLKKEEINIFFRTLKDRKIFDSNLDILSSALPKGIVCNRAYYHSDENGLCIEFERLSDSNKITVNNAYDFIDLIANYRYNCLLIDKKNSINLGDNPHWLVCGSTGSGKTYFVSGLMIQGLIHGYKISVIDVKRTYHQFTNIANVCFDKISILSYMRELEQELYIRQEEMEQHLKIDSTLTACMCGIHNHLIVIEEYIALVSVLDKNELKEFEKILTEIVVMGRQLGMHVIVVSQIALANTINSNIRSNLSKIAMRVSDESLLKTTFGISTSTKLLKNYGKGEGLICYETDILDFKAMSFNIQIEDIIVKLK